MGNFKAIKGLIKAYFKALEIICFGICWEHLAGPFKVFWKGFLVVLRPRLW